MTLGSWRGPRRARGRLVAAIGGALAAWFFDPRSGRQRRARARNALVHARHAGPVALSRAAADLEHRVHGVVARTRSVVEADEIDDAQLVARIRSRLGRTSRSVHAICVDSRGGVVELTGWVRADEARTVFRAVRTTRGVRAVEDRLERRPADASTLRVPPSARRSRGYWPRGQRLALGAVGGGAMLASVLAPERRIARVFGLGGAALLLRSLVNRPFDEIAGVRPLSRGIDVHKTIAIHAPIERVYSFFTSFEEFPRSMQNVQAVDRVDDNRWRFTIRGPAGARIAIDGVILETIPNELVAWTSAENATIETTGSARFERIGPSDTRVTIRMSYRPPVGLVGDALARLSHVDPKHELDTDMVRMKSLLEHASP